MTFPKSQRVIFANNPITEVICQLRFPPILEILTSPPADFQKKLRAEYPLYEREESPGLPRQLMQIVSKLSAASQFSESAVHKFSTESRERIVTLSKEFLAVSATRYENWQEFSGYISAAQQLLETTYAPAFYSRIGLRYVNAIDRSALNLMSENWKDLLNPAFVGVLASPDVAENVVNYQAQTVIDLSAYVPDARVTMRIGLRPDAPGRSTFLIDNDFFRGGKTEKQDVAGVLNEFNRMDGDLFRWAVGDRGPLRDALHPRDPGA